MLRTPYLSSGNVCVTIYFLKFFTDDEILWLFMIYGVWLPMFTIEKYWVGVLGLTIFILTVHPDHLFQNILQIYSISCVNALFTCYYLKYQEHIARLNACSLRFAVQVSLANHAKVYSFSIANLYYKHKTHLFLIELNACIKL